jgi:hypothetical protein
MNKSNVNVYGRVAFSLCALGVLGPEIFGFSNQIGHWIFIVGMIGISVTAIVHFGKLR